jgi:pyruvate dehydrogenase E2 component (dihydrolipoamide acetyltransferase)
MIIDIKMPQMGESVTEGTLVRWLKKVGERVKHDEPLLEISTDKVDTDIGSPAAGVIVEIKVQEGETVPVHTVIDVMSSDGGATHEDGRRS